MKNASPLPAGSTETRVLNQREGGAPAVADDVARDARFAVASQSCCKFAGGSGSRWWSVYATLTSSGVSSEVVGSLPSYLIRLSRWRSSWVNLTPLVACVM